MRNFISHQYNAYTVVASIIIELSATYIALDFARRIPESDRLTGRIWWFAGAVLMGTGVWSMHFVGMQAFQFPMPVEFDGETTFMSWAVAVVASSVAIHYANHEKFGRLHLYLAALLIGGGISAMHFLGMQAMQLSPGIVWNIPLAVLAVLLSFVSAACALSCFQASKNKPEHQKHVLHSISSVIMAAGIVGMHYTGMSAANFIEGSICRTENRLSGPGLTELIFAATGLLLLSALLTSVLDNRSARLTRSLMASLKKSYSSLRAANEELQRKAFSDPLTGLENRLMFEQHLATTIGACGRNAELAGQGEVVILFVDIDGFKSINDAYGHAVGDKILQKIARRLLKSARPCKSVARIASDQFLILLEDVPLESAIDVADQILASISEPFYPRGVRIRLSCSIGVAAYPACHEAERLIQNAELASQSAKKAGGGAYAIFASSMVVDLPKQMHLQQDLASALANERFSLHYQPKLCADTGIISGYEALLRWDHPVHGMISPTVFIPLAERGRLIGKIGAWVIEEACRQMGEWLRMGYRMPVAVNLSVFQLRDRELPTCIATALQKNNVPASQLLCEITESVAMEDVEQAQETFRSLRDIGVFISIDDFGTGYSSLNYLRQLPVQQLKIDRSFIQDIAENNEARSVVDAIVRLSHALGLKVVAEGVETRAQRDVLVDLNVDELQGYLFARPMSADKVLEWAKEQYQPDRTRASQDHAAPSKFSDSGFST